MSTSQEDDAWYERLAQSRRYWGSERGKELVAVQQACLGPVLESRRAQHGLELSAGATLLAQMPPASASDGRTGSATTTGPAHVIQWASSRYYAEHPATLVCPPEALALPDECIDVTVIHHFLEHCPHAHRRLAEAARVTSDNGVLVIFGFHPLGLSLIEHRLGRKRREYPGNGIWKTPSRLRDWLAFVDFEVERVDYCGFHVPGGRACREHWEALGRRYNLPWGASYMIRARRKRHRARIQRPKFGLHASVASRPFGATRLQPAAPDNDTSKRKKR